MNIHKQIVEAIHQASNIVITSHKSPDGDSVGSSLALYHFIHALGKSATICHPDAAPSFLHWLEGTDRILNFDDHSEQVSDLLANADLIFCLDYNSPDRVGKEMQPHLENAGATKIMIDHHIHPAAFCALTLSDTSACSTAQLIFQLIDLSGNNALLSAQIGTPIYLGIMTDSGSFRYPSVQASTHEIAAQLIRVGVNHSEIHENVFDTNTLDRLRLRGYLLSEKLEIHPTLPIAILSVNEEILSQFNYTKGDTEGLVNIALSIQGIKVAAFFSEKEGAVKISFRSKGTYSVNQLASDHFNGGGHIYAAGGISYAPLAETIEQFKTVAPSYFT